MAVQSNQPKGRSLSSAPSAMLALKTTVDHWLQNNEGKDQEVDLRDAEMTKRLVHLYYEESLKEFEPFLFEGGLIEEELTRFKAAVVDYLAGKDFLKDDPTLLPAAITHVLVTFDLGDKKLIDVIEAMEIGYRRLVPADDEQAYLKGKLLLVHELVARIVDLNR